VEDSWKPGSLAVACMDGRSPKIETESNRDRIVDRKIESKLIEIDKAES